MIETKSIFKILLFLGSVLGQTGYDVHGSGVAHNDGVAFGTGLASDSGLALDFGVLDSDAAAFGTGLALDVSLAHSPGATTVGDGSPINPNKNEMDGTDGTDGTAGTAESAEGMESAEGSESTEATESVEGSETAESAGTIVFVHGAWGGGWDYKSMEAILEREGFDVYRPSLTGLGERAHLNSPDVNVDTHIMDIVNVLEFEELTDVILVGHSYGGMVITGVAHRVPERIAHLVYVDAILPDDGESVFGLGDPEGEAFVVGLAEERGDGWRIPPYWPEVGKDVAHPLETFRQPIVLGNPDAEGIPATYVLTYEGEPEADGFYKYAVRAKERGWEYEELVTGHNPQRTMPNEYAEILVAVSRGER